MPAPILMQPHRRHHTISPRLAMPEEESTMLCSLLAMMALGAKPEAYPKTELIIEPAALAELDALKKYVILDVRGEKSYAEGHVPGAVRVEVAALSKLFNADTSE